MGVLGRDRGAQRLDVLVHLYSSRVVAGALALLPSPLVHTTQKTLRDKKRVKHLNAFALAVLHGSA